MVQNSDENQPKQWSYTWKQSCRPTQTETERENTRYSGAGTGGQETDVSGRAQKRKEPPPCDRDLDPNAPPRAPRTAQNRMTCE